MTTCHYMASCYLILSRYHYLSSYVLICDFCHGLNFFNWLGKYLFMLSFNMINFGVFSSQMSSNSLGRTQDSNDWWTLAINHSWASGPSLSAITSGHNCLYIDLWSTCQLCVKIFVVVAEPTSILGPRWLPNLSMSSGNGAVSSWNVNHLNHSNLQNWVTSDVSPDITVLIFSHLSYIIDYKAL